MKEEKTPLEQLREKDRKLSYIRKINTSLPKRKAAKFDEIENGLITDRSVFAFNNKDKINKELIAEEAKK